MNKGVKPTWMIVSASFSLSAILTIALLYSTLELPNLLNRALLDVFPDYGHHWEEAERLIGSLRPIGYVCFMITMALMILGFILKRGVISTAGSLSLLLPTFGYFASTMFFLAGIGMLRIMWLPILEMAPGPWPGKPQAVAYILELGDSVFFLHIAIRILAGTAGYAGARLFDWAVFYVLVLSGSAVFSLGCSAWLYGRLRGLRLIDFWIYRYSRHPQYLGFLIWSYGLLIYDRFIFMPPRGGYFPSPPLLWLFATMAILGTALREEAEMLRKHAERYAEYRGRTPFMLPLPSLISNLVTAPVRRIFGKEYPEKGREIILTLALYGSFLILTSIPYSPPLP